jgi:flagellin-like protein
MIPMRSISPVVAIVVLLLMTVAAAGMAFLTITTYQNQASGSSEGGIEKLAAAGQSQIKVESLGNGRIYLRSFGVPCQDLIVQVGNEPAQVLGDCNTSLSIFNITSSCESGQQTVKINSGNQIITQQISCLELIGSATNETAPPDYEPPVVYPASPVATQNFCPSHCTGVVGFFSGCSYTLYFNVTVDDSSTGNSHISGCNHSIGTGKGAASWVEMTAYDGAFDSPIEIAVGSVTVAARSTVNITCWDAELNENSTDKWYTGTKGTPPILTFTVRGCSSGYCVDTPPNCPTACTECI